MILPNKYITLPESFIGLSSYILEIIGNKEMSFEDIYNKFYSSQKIAKKFSSKPTMEKFSLCLSFMYASGMIQYSEGGVIFNENLKFENS